MASVLSFDLTDDFDGVCAYSAGDERPLGRSELRYRICHFMPYLFADIGRITLDADPAAGVLNNKRTISGGGAGTRFQYAGFNADLIGAYRFSGGQPLSDGTSNESARFWLSLGYAF